MQVAAFPLIRHTSYGILRASGGLCLRARWNPLTPNSGQNDQLSYGPPIWLKHGVVSCLSVYFYPLLGVTPGAVLFLSSAVHRKQIFGPF